MKKIFEYSIITSNLSKTILYTLEYRLLYFLSKSLSRYVTPPTEETNKKLLNHLGDGVIALHYLDAENISKGVYPFEVIIPKSPLEHIKNIPYLMIDSLKISRRRKLNIKKDFDIEPEDTPDYLNRNYHFQTDGYFSDQSARIYEHQVEVLFSGTAGPMRRMLIKYIKEKLNSGKTLRILELGAGVGSATLDFVKSFEISQYTVTDVSKPYLALAKKRLLKNNKTTSFEFVQAPAESLPFQAEEFDLVFSVYLFHELPRNIREKALSESYRVLAPGGIIGICDSLQINDDKILNNVLEKFPKDYHEPFYLGYINWDLNQALTDAGFSEVESKFNLLSKYWTAVKT
jgi:ubiquinone/menaquinone biosynthesis C-methylase UbiE